MESTSRLARLELVIINPIPEEGEASLESRDAVV